MVFGGFRKYNYVPGTQTYNDKHPKWRQCDGGGMIERQAVRRNGLPDKHMVRVPCPGCPACRRENARPRRTIT